MNKFVYIVFNSRRSRAPRANGGYRSRAAIGLSHPVVSSEQSTLQRLLSARSHPDVKLLLESGVFTISAVAALGLTRSGEYHWCGSRHKVRKMRPVQTHRWQSCYRTTRSATLQPAVDWPQRVSSKACSEL